MNREKLKASIHEALDRNKDKKVTVEDLISIAEGNQKKLLWIGIGLGLLGGFVAGWLIKMMVG